MNEKHELICTNGVVQAQPKNLFQFLITNYADDPREVLEGKVVASAFSSPTRLAASTLTMLDIFGLADSQRVSDDTKRNLSFPQVLPMVTSGKEQTASIDTLTLDRFRG